MDQPTLALTLQTLVSEKVLNGAAAPGLDDDLLLSGLIDSLGMMVLLDAVQEELGRTIPAEDVSVENFSSISSIAAYLHQE